MADTDPAIEWLESGWERRHPYRAPNALDRQHVRPIFEVLYDHAHYNPRSCFFCKAASELIVIEYDREE